VNSGATLKVKAELENLVVIRRFVKERTQALHTKPMVIKARPARSRSKFSQKKARSLFACAIKPLFSIPPMFQNPI
jgi:hypothetical protein